MSPRRSRCPDWRCLRAWATLFTGSVLVLAAHGQGVVTGWQVAGGFQSASITARADWSSDLGADWVYSNAAAGSSTVWTGPGTTAASAPYGLVASGLTLDYRLDARGGAVGNTYSGGTLQVTDDHVLSTPARSEFHLYSVLGANDAYYGIGTSTRVNGYFSITSPVTPYAPVHYRVDWTLARQGDALSGNELYFDGQWRTLAAGSGSFSGVFDAADYLWWTNGSALYPQMIVSTSASDASLAPGSGRTDLWLAVSFANAPISAVPEPGSAATFSLGAVALAMLTLRRRPARCAGLWRTQA